MLRGVVHSVKFLILFTIWLLTIASFSFLLLPYKGEVVGLSIALVYLIMVFYLFDKWILLFFMAKESQRGDENSKLLSNLAYVHNIKGAKIFYSRKEIGNIVALDWKGQKILILEDRYKDNKLGHHIIEEALGYFKTGKVRANTRLAFIFAIYNAPLILLEKYLGGFKLFGLLVAVYLSPFQIITDNHVLKNQLREEPSLRKDGRPEMDVFTEVILKILGIYKVKNNDLISMVLNKEY